MKNTQNEKRANSCLTRRLGQQRQENAQLLFTQEVFHIVASSLLVLHRQVHILARASLGRKTRQDKTRQDDALTAWSKCAKSRVAANFGATTAMSHHPLSSKTKLKDGATLRSSPQRHVRAAETQVRSASSPYVKLSFKRDTQSNCAREENLSRALEGTGDQHNASGWESKEKTDARSSSCTPFQGKRWCSQTTAHPIVCAGRSSRNTASSLKS